MDRSNLPANPSWEHCADCLPDLRPPCLSSVGSEIRESLPSACRDSDCSDVPALRDLRRLDRGERTTCSHQIGFNVLAGLACKNAILIVEFARELETEGSKTLAAAIEAARLRLRPILMTSFAFIMGVVPLVASERAGAEMRRAMGVAVFSGMLGVTFFGLFLTPLFYVVVRTLEK